MSSRLYITSLILVGLQITASKPAKSNARPVHEIVNEQARIDDKRLTTSPGNLPYGNPLAGNSQQNARLHAQNQQAMFNAERVRQHRAQLQRWTKAPPQVDSYMKAYHESQESHQLAVEQQQAKQEDNPKPVSLRTKNPRQDTRSMKILQNQPIKITKADAIKPDKNRNHRSHGSVEYQQYLQPKRYKTVYLSPGPTYDQGVTIKPNGNIGLTHLKSSSEEQTKLYTEAIPSKYVYPKQYSQMHEHQSYQNINALNSILKKNPTEQLTELNALISSDKGISAETGKGGLDTPVDLYFYLKDPTAQSLSQHYDHSLYAQIPSTYASAYMPEGTEHKDYKPITEEVDDIEDPNKNNRFKTYGVQPAIATPTPNTDTSTTKCNNYYKVEVASQTVSGGYKPIYENKIPQFYSQDHEEDKPTYQALKYAHQPNTYYAQNPKTEEDLSERYLHHNAKQVGVQHLSEDGTGISSYLHHNANNGGVQHLSEDGTGVSAYGDDNLHYAANYEFGYRVRDQYSGNDFGHHEAKSNGKTKGHYHVLLPDGRMQKVKYSAGPEGFHADISYDHLQ